MRSPACTSTTLADRRADTLMPGHGEPGISVWMRRSRMWCYLSVMASLGHTSAQVPHSVQSSGRARTATSSRSRALEGHSSTQMPHAVHRSGSTTGLPMMVTVLSFSGLAALHRQLTCILTPLGVRRQAHLVHHFAGIPQAVRIGTVQEHLRRVVRRPRSLQALTQVGHHGLKQRSK